jgi:TetR/AcrR family transcriptional regulator, transcriptional repressor for nem operon
MRVDRKTMAEHRAAILRQAGRLFRQHGIDGVAVADITSAAGLTHGAFYGHFPSKTALAAESCRHSLETSARFWRERAAAARAEGTDPLEALIDSYLTPERRDSREASCMLASVGPEASRNPELCPDLTIGVTALTDVLRELIGERQPTADPKQHYQAALAVLAALSGGLNLARALSADPERSAAALESAAALAKRAAECLTPAK